MYSGYQMEQNKAKKPLNSTWCGKNNLTSPNLEVVPAAGDGASAAVR